MQINQHRIMDKPLMLTSCSSALFLIFEPKHPIMKRVALFLLLFPFNLVFAQQKDALIEVRTDEREFRGSINEKYAITVYLKYYQSSGEHMGVYSVKGWYYYDNIQKKIPLVGLYDGDLTLFVFKQKEKQDSILEFKYGSTNLWEGLELLKGISGFDEKMIYGSDVKEWITPTKTLPMAWWSEDLSVERNTAYIKTAQNKELKYIDLDEMLGYVNGCELIHSIHTATENSFLLKYEYGSNPYVQGRCGAGTEEGYIVLKYDGSYNFLSVQNAELYSCYNDIYNETMKSTNPDQICFKVHASEDKISTVTIDLVKNTITVK